LPGEVRASGSDRRAGVDTQQVACFSTGTTTLP
jgi:hypothetical protein